jgi:glycosyltransferase involved in cell wall biosynthesis
VLRFSPFPTKAVYHHVTFATACLPTAALLLPGRFRVILGPANGTSTRDRWAARSILRNRLQRLFSAANVRRADVLVAQNHLAEREWRRWAPNGDTLVEPNVVVDEDLVGLKAARRARGKIVSVGALTRNKRHDLVIRALADKRLQQHRLTIVGGGPEEATLRALAVEVGVSERVRLTGWVPHGVALNEIAAAESLVLVSESEGAGWSVGEAQALGVVPVVRRGTGAETMTKLTGIGRDVSRDANSAELAAVLSDLAKSPAPSPCSRWRRSRLPELLEDWYGLLGSTLEDTTNRTKT